MLEAFAICPQRRSKIKPFRFGYNILYWVFIVIIKIRTSNNYCRVLLVKDYKD